MLSYRVGQFRLLLYVFPYRVQHEKLQAVNESPETIAGLALELHHPRLGGFEIWRDEDGLEQVLVTVKEMVQQSKVLAECVEVRDDIRTV